jgi:predicted nucleic acid-binding protein
LIVADASVLAPALADDADAGDRYRERLRGERLAAPDLVDLEVTSALRTLVSNGSVPARRAALAIVDLSGLPMLRVPSRVLLARIWQLRGSVTAYDAAYVAVAEATGSVLLTADARLSRAPGPQCIFELM